MPRTVQEILAHADELASRFEHYEPSDADELDVESVRALCRAVAEQSQAEQHLVEAIRLARRSGMSWASIGTFVGTSGEAVRQRYKHVAA